ncbi:PREDICTED: uncharacterized protein LOC109187548 [Ipomoea nil]|uniref:uncharacterized protein LOC109187548 n=1 Tax=Ipomoea nil TaxID=35883 RepID=UPI000901B098|nr:PREDICTED: uncharacterized protein LOC109187548 [Ipomoea nil]
MDAVMQSSISQNKSKLRRAFSKVFHIQFVIGAGQEGKHKSNKSHEKKEKNGDFNAQFKRLDDADEKLRLIAAEAFLARVFASVSSVKAAYAQLQFSQSPYDPDGICAADKMVVSELKILSELKQCYFKKQIDDECSPQTTLLLAEIQEHKCSLRTYDIMGKKLCSQVKLKDSEIAFLREKLVEIDTEKRVLEKRLNSISVPSELLSLSFFITYLLQTVESIQSFTRVLCGEMESAGWDLDAAARSIQPGVVFWKANHKRYAFESFVCGVMFDGFNYQNLSVSSSEQKKQQERLFFDRFMEQKSDYLAWKPKSTFATFCCNKYLRLIHPRMEESLFGNLDQRARVKSGKYPPETAFFTAFSEMANRVWLLHCLAFSFDPEEALSIFQVSRKTRFSEIFMETVNEEAFLLSETEPRVAFTVVPGFRIGKTVVQCQVYLC